MKINKYKSKVIGLALLGLLAAGPLAAGEGKKHGDHAGGREKMAKELKLTDEQKVQIKKIREESRGQSAEMRKQQEERILAVLNDEQKKKFQEAKAKREGDHKKRKEEWKSKRDHSKESSESK